MAGKLKSLFGAGSTSATETETAAEKEGTEPAKSDGDESASSPAEAATQIDPPEKKTPPKDTIPLKVNVKSPISLSMNSGEKRTARDRFVLTIMQYTIISLMFIISRILAIDKEEVAKRVKEEARNTLEGYLYRVRDLLEEEGDTPFRKCSKEPERTAMQETLEETFSWLHDHGDDASTHDYISRRTSIE